MKVLLKKEMQNCLILEVSMKLRSYVMLNESDNVMKTSSAELQWVIEKLMYIVCETQSDIIFIIDYLSQNLINT